MNHFPVVLGEASESISNTPLWGPIQNIARALGVIFVLFGIINTVRQLASGKTTGAIKVAVITVIGAIFLFDLAIIETILNVGKSVVDLLVQSVSKLIGSTGTGTGTGSGGGGGGTGSTTATTIPCFNAQQCAPGYVP